MFSFSSYSVLGVRNLVAEFSRSRVVVLAFGLPFFRAWLNALKLDAARAIAEFGTTPKGSEPDGGEGQRTR